ncbi:hypothetical protein TWF788_003894 [Orbilia oligospora]|uniref:Uncharacterized protein n=1 Tax=Orbilia oligospora TaxID=2813651 RepID=A0A7C8TY88_ORBOL|nr:hypothetical protein TWF788_003894 [Orbilia oligospora]
MAGLRRKETEDNIRQLYLNQAEDDAHEGVGPSSGPAQATMGADSTMQQNSEGSTPDPMAGDSQHSSEGPSQSSVNWKSSEPKIRTMRKLSKIHFKQYSWLSLVDADDYIYFVELCLEEAIWWVETRLTFEKYTTVPPDSFKGLFDDPDEALVGYGFLTEERNKDLVNRGFFDILSNYQKRASGTVPPPAGFLRPAEVDANIPPPPPSPPLTKTKKFKKFLLSCGLGSENKKRPVKNECDRIGNLLVGAGYRPDPADTPTILELQRGDYPDPVQYHNDVQVFLELIMCLLFATCPKILDVRDILSLSFINVNRSEGYRTLHYENGHLVILSFDWRVKQYFRTIIPDPLSRLILIFLIDIRPFIAFLNTGGTVENSHWHQEYLFPCKAGGCLTMDVMNDILENHTKKKLGIDNGMGLWHLRSVYFNLESELGEGWLYDTVEEVVEAGVTVRKAMIKWSRNPPAATVKGHPGGERYLSKQYQVAA